MNSDFSSHLANEEFSQARSKEFITRILNFLTPHRQVLLRLDEVKKLIQTRGETNRGLQAVELKKIVGSEGRYRDFNRFFMPKHEYLRNRWTRLDMARLQNVTLPPIHLYEIGGVYFVRDGNHRVSIARQNQVEQIDAVVISLNTDIRLTERTTLDDMKKQVIQLEKEAFYQATGFTVIFPDQQLCFTTTGRYQEIRKILDDHQKHMQRLLLPADSLRKILQHWYEVIFLPMKTIIKRSGILSRFPKRTVDDLALWVISHQGELERTTGTCPSPREAVLHYSQTYGTGRVYRYLGNFLSRVFLPFKKSKNLKK